MNNDNNRLDRIEVILEQITQNIQQMGYRVDSNARAIEALTTSISEYQRDRSRLYALMSDLTQGQSRLYRVIEDLDERQGQLSCRQGEIVEILKIITQPKPDK